MLGKKVYITRTTLMSLYRARFSLLRILGRRRVLNSRIAARGSVGVGYQTVGVGVEGEADAVLCIAWVEDARDGESVVRVTRKM